MELRARTRTLPRRAATLAAALAVLLASAFAGGPTPAAHAASRPKLPVITSVSPMDVAIGETLTIRGRNFVRGRDKNTVVFKRDGARGVFVKATLGTTKMLQFKVPASLQEFFTLRAGEPASTRFRLRVLAKRFGNGFTPTRLSPLVSAPPVQSPVAPPPAAPPAAQSAAPPADSAAAPPAAEPTDGDCDGDGVKNRSDADDDNDLLSDEVERSLGLDVCKGDTDGDGVADRYEFDCDRDGVLNRDESDDDDDRLSDTLETAIGTDPCKLDTDGDQVEDGYEYQSARDLNDDEFQEPNTDLFYPAKLPYPNPLYAGDANTDFDGDGLPLSDEQALWKYTYDVTHTDARTLTPLSYSDGEQFSRSTRVDGRRQPTLAPDNYDKHADFVDWAVRAGYGTVVLHDYSDWFHVSGGAWIGYDLFDINRTHTVSADELNYFDLETPGTAGHGWLSDNERDEDADGLSNVDELRSRMTPAYWTGCYSSEKPYYVPYAGTSMVDADTDGDGVRDGADDQDHDDIPNLMELSRLAASGQWDATSTCKVDPDVSALIPSSKLRHASDYGRVNPFNPCLPDRNSRTCALYFDATTGAPFDDSINWLSLQ